jgi:hypothetical protein
VMFEMAVIHEQHINITFCFKLSKTFTEIHEMMKNIYNDQCMSRTCYEWFKQFKDCRQSTHEEPRLGRPSVSCDDGHVQVHEIMHSNRRLTVGKSRRVQHIDRIVS